jgi:hypothetical protein
MTNATEAHKPAPRKKRGEGRDPLIISRAPATLIALATAAARERRVSVSEVIRQALARYVADDAA